MREATYQTYLISFLQNMFPGCFILKNDSGYLQGVPDLLVLHRGKWAMLEVKTRENAPEQPNQRHYVEYLNGLSYATFIYPENEEEVLNDLQLLFTS